MIVMINQDFGTFLADRSSLELMAGWGPEGRSKLGGTFGLALGFCSLLLPLILLVLLPDALLGLLGFCWCFCF